MRVHLGICLVCQAASLSPESSAVSVGLTAGTALRDLQGLMESLRSQLLVAAAESDYVAIHQLASRCQQVESEASLWACFTCMSMRIQRLLCMKSDFTSPAYFILIVGACCSLLRFCILDL